MAQLTLLPNTGSVATGTGYFISTAVTQANLEFAPQANTGFSGTVYIDSSTAPNPGANDWFTIATLVFSAQTTTVDINLYLSTNPWIRARIAVAPSIGSISVYLAY
jgi:hypothetical protein